LPGCGIIIEASKVASASWLYLCEVKEPRRLEGSLINQRAIVAAERRFEHVAQATISRIVREDTGGISK